MNVSVCISLWCFLLRYTRYSWKKNGLTLDVSGDRFTYKPGSGNLTISGMLPGDEGNYICFASNKFGTAVGRTIKLKKAGKFHENFIFPSFAFQC